MDQELFIEVIGAGLQVASGVCLFATQLSPSRRWLLVGERTLVVFLVALGGVMLAGSMVRTGGAMSLGITCTVLLVAMISPFGADGGQDPYASIYPPDGRAT
ncbi:MAG: hypothetical protein ACRC1K_07695 [Planctomycetia bacterium]